MSARAFAVEPPGKGPYIFAAVLGLSLLIGVTVLAVFDAGASDMPLGVTIAAVSVTVSCGLLIAMVRRRRVALSATTLHIVGGLHRYDARVEALDLDAARIVDLREHRELRPALKTWGTAMPGFHAGRFRLADRKPAFVLLTRREHVLLLPQRDGPRLLLSLKQPRALLDALARARRERGAALARAG